jgi:hypothetical protein
VSGIFEGLFAMREATVEELATFLKKQLEEKPVVPLVEQMVRDRSSLAGTSRESIFTREFLCPAIKYFYTQVCQNLNLHADEIHKNLQMEGFKTVKGFGSTPASKRMHLFTKDLVIKSEPRIVVSRWQAPCRLQSLSRFRDLPTSAALRDCRRS